jgi:hypothetical protein
MERDLMVLPVVLLSLTDHCQFDTQIQRYIRDLPARATAFLLHTESGRNDTMYSLAIVCTQAILHQDRLLGSCGINFIVSMSLCACVRYECV